jgi:hypothetical protein
MILEKKLICCVFRVRAEHIATGPASQGKIKIIESLAGACGALQVMTIR